MYPLSPPNPVVMSTGGIMEEGDGTDGVRGDDEENQSGTG
ncbi:hypothetical protein AYX14_07149 [Cryptococcus neoformans]|nr:hypothetical protein AYX14_07149 [Cryptococcus neoformans var. grubii]